MFSLDKFFQIFNKESSVQLEVNLLYKKSKIYAMKKHFCFHYTFFKQKSIATSNHQAFCLKTEFNTSKKFFMHKNDSI